MTNNFISNETPIVGKLSIISMKGCEGITAKIDEYLRAFRGYEDTETYVTHVTCPRFGTGEGKCVIDETVRGHDVYIICDVFNYGVTYKMYGVENHMSPDDHYQDLKRVIAAMGGKARRVTVVMPMLYEGRQHRRNYRESLDCAVALQELQNMGVSNIVAFDAHDPRVCNAVPLMGFDNIIPTYQVLKALFKYVNDFKMDMDHFMVVSPDEGALNRNMYYSSVLGVDLGMFYKRRDYSRVVNGRNPIVAHEYLGNSVEGKDVFIADDIISSGESMLDIAIELKKRNAKRIFAYATYPIFTNGLEAFDKAYADGKIDYVFGTNLSYRTPELLSREWFCEVDVSKYLSYLIMALNHDMSISKVIDPHQKISALLEKHKND